MARTLDDLITPESQDQVLTYLLTQLAYEGFPTTAWQSGGVAYTLLKIEALALSDKIRLIASIARGGLLDLAEGPWLTLLAKSAYDLDRITPAFAEGMMRLTCARGFGPYTLSPGQLWAHDTSGHRFNASNVGNIIVPSNDSARMPFRAESPGSRFNLALGTPLTLATPLPGLRVELQDLGEGTWLTTQGTDGEPDTALRTRCRARWATVGLQKTRDAYVFLATSVPRLATPPTRVYVDDTNPRGPGTVDVWIAGPAGPLGSDAEATVREFVVARKSVTADVRVQNASPLPIDVVADVYFRSQYTRAITEATDALTQLIHETDLGGFVSVAEMYRAICAVDGVFDAKITTPNANVIVARNQVAVPRRLQLLSHPS